MEIGDPRSQVDHTAQHLKADGCIHVAAGVVVRPDGRFLLAIRPDGKIGAGFAEFPGGKLEPGETAYEALVRELDEELGIRIQVATPWIVRTVAYPHAIIRLHFFQVFEWEGEPYPCEGQQLIWQHPHQSPTFPILPANQPILRSLMVPSYLAFSNVAELGKSGFLYCLEEKVRQIPKDTSFRIPFWVVLREPQLTRPAYYDLAGEVISLVQHRGVKILLHNHLDFVLKLGADGIHFSSKVLASIPCRPPGINWIGASVHTQAELAIASPWTDYAVLGPVAITRSHPSAPPLGWDKFAGIMQPGWPLPVFAIGGMSPKDVLTAQARGGHGIASLRAFWEQ